MVVRAHFMPLNAPFQRRPPTATHCLWLRPNGPALHVFAERVLSATRPSRPLCRLVAPKLHGATGSPSSAPAVPQQCANSGQLAGKLGLTSGACARVHAPLLAANFINNHSDPIQPAANVSALAVFTLIHRPLKLKLHSRLFVEPPSVSRSRSGAASACSLARSPVWPLGAELDAPLSPRSAAAGHGAPALAARSSSQSSAAMMSPSF